MKKRLNKESIKKEKGEVKHPFKHITCNYVKIHVEDNIAKLIC